MKKELSLEDLVRIASQEAVAEKLSTMEEFIAELNLFPTEESRAEGQVIYWVYIKWCDRYQYPVLTRNKFFKEFQRFFRKRKIPYRHMYYVNPEPFSISREQWLEMRAYFHVERQKNKKKTRLNKEPIS